MNGFVAMLRKEFIETARTWRVWLVGAVFLVFGLIDPVIAKYTPQILGSVIGDQLPITVPDPTYLNAWAQWTKDLSQLLLTVVIVLAAGTVANEANSGTLIMPLTKPVSRSAFVLAKFVATTSLVMLALAIATGLASAVTAVLFDDVEFGPIWAAVAVWLVFAVMMTAATMAASCLAPNTIAAFGLGFGLFVLINIVAIWQPATAYSPAGLPAAVGQLAQGNEVQLVWPLSTAAVATAVLIATAILIFRRRQL